METPTKGAITGMVAVHLGVTLWHGGAHQSLGVWLSPVKSAFVHEASLDGPPTPGQSLGFHCLSAPLGECLKELAKQPS